MKVIKIEDFFKISNFFFRVIGIFPYKDPNRKESAKIQLFMNLIFLLGYTNLLICFIQQNVYILKALAEGNILAAFIATPCTGIVALSFFKVVYMNLNSNNITELIQGLNDLMPKEEKAQNIFKVNFHLRKVLKLGSFYTVVLSTSIWAFNLLPLAWSLIEFLFASDNNRNFEFRLPFVCYYPFSIDCISKYVFAYVTQVFGGITSSGGLFSCDILMFNLILLICMNFNYVENNISKNSQNLNDIIKHHQRILE